MSDDFNLLGGGPQRSESGLTMARIGWVALIVVLLGIAAAFWTNVRAGEAEKRIAAGNAAIEDLVANLQERSQFLAQKSANPELVGRLQDLERETTDKGRVLNGLSGKTLGNSTGFSGELAALGRRHPDGLWLQSLRFGDGGREVTIRGRALSASLVPQFIGALRQEPAFTGVSFERFEMKDPRDASGPLSFALESGCDDASTPDIEVCPEPPPPPPPPPPFPEGTP